MHIVCIIFILSWPAIDKMLQHQHTWCVNIRVEILVHFFAHFYFWFNLFNFLIFFKEHQRHHDLFSYKNDVGFGGITARIFFYLSIMRNALDVATSYPHKLVVFFSIWINNKFLMVLWQKYIFYLSFVNYRKELDVKRR